jgi:hypothetical protein
MMLWESELEKAVIMNKTYIDDGRGGTIPSYVPGLEIDAVFGWDSSEQMRIAEQANAIPRYTITTRKNINLQFHDVLKRVRDGKIFRITSDGDDNYSPDVSTLNMRQYEAEKWELPNG